MLSRFAAGLPHGLRHRLQKFYYPRVVRNFPPERWPPSALVRRLLAPGARVVDGGANIGYVTRLLSEWVGAAGRVYSFEPVPETFSLLAHNVRRLQLTNVELFNCALSAHSGEAAMEIPTYPWGGDNLYESALVAESVGASAAARRVSVACRRLDEVLPAGPVTLIKLDVEGHEAEAIEGAWELIVAHRPALVVEMNRSNWDNPGPWGRLMALGYSLCAAAGTAVRPWDADSGPDALFLQSDHWERLVAGDTGRK